MAQVNLRKLLKHDDEVQAVRGIDLDIADKEFVVLVGPSGCGKTTTLRMIAGLEDITDGDILIGGDVVNDVPPKDRDIAMVFHFDEPLSNLDAKLRVHMRTEIKKVHQKVRTTTVYVTHDQVEAMTLADRVVVMNAGLIEQIGTPHELYHSPATLFVAGFIGSPAMNMMRCGLEETAGALRLNLHGAIALPVPQERIARYRAHIGKDKLLLGLRPEHLTEMRA